MRPWLLWGLFGAALLACSKSEPAPAPAPASAEAKTPSLAAAELCELTMGAPRRHLEARCSAEDKKSPTYGHLVRLTEERTRRCITALASDVGPGHATILDGPARACAEALEKISWKDTLLDRSLAFEPACRQLVVGTQKIGERCHVDAACEAGLVCAAASPGREGVCAEPPAKGQACAPRAPAEIGWLSRSPCKAGRCNAAPTPRRFFLGYDGPVEGDAARGIDRILRGLPPDDSEPVAPEAQGELRTIAGPIAGGPFRPHDSTRPGPPAFPKVRMGAVAVSGRLAPEIVRRIVRRELGKLRSCYQDALRRDPRIEGDLTVRFVIAADGSTSSVRAAGGLSDAGMESCVSRIFHAISFPKPEGGLVTVAYPLTFSPPEEAELDAPTPEVSVSASATPPPTGDVCLAGGCGHDGDCGPAESCVARSCRALGAIGEACEDSHDCGPASFCDQGACALRREAGMPCSSSLECAGICSPGGTCISFCAAPEK